MNKRRGMSLPEILIAVLIFAFGIFAVSTSLMYSLKAIIGSRAAIKSDMYTVNTAERYLLERLISHDISPSGMAMEGGTVTSQATATVKLCGKDIKYKIFKLDMNEKPSPIFIFQREE